MYSKFYQNRRDFVEDMKKTFWCVFFVHSEYWPIETKNNV